METYNGIPLYPPQYAAVVISATQERNGYFVGSLPARVLGYLISTRGIPQFEPRVATLIGQIPSEQGTPSAVFGSSLITRTGYVTRTGNVSGRRMQHINLPVSSSVSMIAGVRPFPARGMYQQGTIANNQNQNYRITANQKYSNEHAQNQENDDSLYQDQSLHSTGARNLAVPMTPQAGKSDSFQQSPNIQSVLAVNVPAPSFQGMDVPSPSIQNIVSTVNLGVLLNLHKIAYHARNVEYNPKRLNAVIMRIHVPKTTALIFSSGKIVCIGAMSEEMSRLAARKYARILQKLGFNAKFREFKVQNMVGSCDVRFPIQLECLNLVHSQFSIYEPELFPGLIYRMVKPCVSLLIYASGKVVITGAKSKSDIDDAFIQIYPILKGFKK